MFADLNQMFIIIWMRVLLIASYQNHFFTTNCNVLNKLKFQTLIFFITFIIIAWSQRFI